MDSQEENKVRPLNLKLQVNVHPQAEWLCRNRLTGALKWNYFRLLHSNLGQKKTFWSKKKKLRVLLTFFAFHTETCHLFG